MAPALLIFGSDILQLIDAGCGRISKGELRMYYGMTTVATITYITYLLSMPHAVIVKDDLDTK